MLGLLQPPQLIPFGRSFVKNYTFHLQVEVKMKNLFVRVLKVLAKLVFLWIRSSFLRMMGEKPCLLTCFFLDFLTALSSLLDVFYCLAEPFWIIQ
jgi:hypothetical protein